MNEKTEIAGILMQHAGSFNTVKKTLNKKQQSKNNNGLGKNS